ncbi:restriction endonuclease subunit S [Vibrio parahaemolyticus]|uniref:restriction endonuclease subunit S n=1 Tax=Vibrio parahaemolyticus TaxID=670 RepID=UPI0011226065|nr:restriction endonuclease subunit S [Vibrio parahaemolyticus]EJG0043336.1 restriction endonuclease subunit S [Vibrio parahaemolyticus]EJO4008823.1 restriction endonuclease subunit S [Vibrio parahaemolyticus]TOA02220.1 restriction endonuclease [Vibrio parahaemolyticus]
MSFELTTLGEIALGSNGAVDGPFGSNLKASSYTESGIPVIRGSNLSLGLDEFKSDEFVYVGDDTYSRLARSECLPQDIIFTKKGTLGQTGFVPQEPYPSYLISSNQMRLRVDPAKANPKYVYYWVSSKKAIDKIRGESEHTGVPKINLDYLKKFPISLPSVSYQNSAVEILDNLNDKIALNTQTSQTLEEMAQAIFKSWFVDFDPVKAKMNGEQPDGMDAATASLFPDKLVESELGLIPEGWEVKNVGEFTDTFDYVANGSFAALKANVELFDEPNDVLYVRTTDFNKGFKNDLKYTNESSYQFLSKSKLYGHETIISNVGDVGTVFRAPSWYDMPMTLGSNAMGIVAKGANSYIYYLFKSHTGQHLLDGITSGSAQMKFNKTSFRKLRVILPSNELLVKFEDLEASLWAKHASNQKESLHLEKLRDTLLPKLLSGEIELGQAQELAEVE